MTTSQTLSVSQRFLYFAERLKLGFSMLVAELIEDIQEMGKRFKKFKKHGRHENHGWQQHVREQVSFATHPEPESVLPELRRNSALVIPGNYESFELSDRDREIMTQCIANKRAIFVTSAIRFSVVHYH